MQKIFYKKICIFGNFRVFRNIKKPVFGPFFGHFWVRFLASKNQVCKTLTAKWCVFWSKNGPTFRPFFGPKMGTKKRAQVKKTHAMHIGFCRFPQDFLAPVSCVGAPGCEGVRGSSSCRSVSSWWFLVIYIGYMSSVYFFCGFFNFCALFFIF